MIKTRIEKHCSLISSARRSKYLINIQTQSVTLPRHEGILRNGKNVGQCFPKTEPVRNIAEMMVGEKLTEPKKGSTVTNVLAMQVKNLNWYPNDLSNKQLKQINLSVNKGEIVGLIGDN